jgi:hypothetical protein
MKILSIGIGALLLGLAYVPGSQAASQYAVVSTSQANTGGFFSAQNVSMSASWSPNSPCSFIVKTNWVAFNGSNATSKDWIELGRVNGSVRSPSGNSFCGSERVGFYDAYYTATGRINAAGVLTYNETPITTISTSGSHNYQIKKISSTEWRTYIDGITTLTYTGWNYPTSVRHDVGWETNSLSPFWTSPNYSSSHQVLINGTWTNWSSGSRNDASTGWNNLGWFANFDGAFWKAKYNQ